MIVCSEADYRTTHSEEVTVKKHWVIDVFYFRLICQCVC